MTPRGTDWSLAALTALLVVSGLASWALGGPGSAWIVVAHDVAGLALAGVLGWKLRRVWGRLLRRRWDARTSLGVLALLVVGLTLVSGLIWSAVGRYAFWGFTGLAWHTAVGFVLAAVVLAHLVVRAKRPRRRDLTDRRQFLTAGATLGLAGAAWWLQDPVGRALGLDGSRRRFTGSYASGDFTGNAFPATSWVADDPDVIDPARWRLQVGGNVERPFSVGLPRLDRTGDELTALLDCTGGFTSTQEWRGVRLSRLLQAARPGDGASHVRVTSVTGYRWWFTLDEADGLLLATRVGGEPLSHGHGAPLRLVVPDQRGFTWVKWVVGVEVIDGPDLGAPVATLTSSV